MLHHSGNIFHKVHDPDDSPVEPEGYAAPIKSIGNSTTTPRDLATNLIMMAGQITMHARQLITGLGRSNIWRHIFSDICQKYAVTNS